MGTSTSYDGPTGSEPLLPPWAPDPVPEPEEDQPEDESPEEQPEEESPKEDRPADDEEGPPVPEWRVPKSAMTRFTNGGGADRGRFSRTARGAVQSQGGSRSAAGAARSGRSTTVRLGGALSALARGGAAELTAFLGRQFIGQDADALLAELMDVVAPDGADNEGAAARVAAADTLEVLFEEYAVQDGGLDALDALTGEAVGEVIERYVETYIYTRLMQLLASRLESKAASPKAACRMEREIKGYIEERVKLEKESRDWLGVDWSGTEGERLVVEVFTEGYQLIETWEE